MPLPEDMGHYRKSLEKRRFSLIAGLVPVRSGTGDVMPHVLDMGCGSGWLSEILRNRGFRVTALDLGLDSIKRAQARMKNRSVNVSFVLGDMYSLPVKEGSFDAVIASEVLEHCDRPHDALCEIVRAVKPGGYVIVSTPYRERIEYTLCIHCNRKTPVNAHLHSFDAPKMTQMLGDAGCEVERTVTFVNRPAERLGMAGLTFFLPFGAWRFLDAIACGMLGRESFMAVRAIRRE